MRFHILVTSSVVLIFAAGYGASFASVHLLWLSKTCENHFPAIKKIYAFLSLIFASCSFAASSLASYILLEEIDYGFGNELFTWQQIMGFTITIAIISTLAFLATASSKYNASVPEKCGSGDTQKLS